MISIARGGLSFKMEDETACEFVSSRGLTKSCSFKNKSLQSDTFHIDNFLDQSPFPSVVHICTRALGVFVERYLNKLPKPIVLVTNDSDVSITSESSWFIPLIESPMIKLWFAQNCMVLSKPAKLKHIPIGLDYHTIAENDIFWGPRMTPFKQEQELKYVMQSAVPFWQRKAKCYTTFNFALDRGDRREAFQLIHRNLIDYEKSPIPRCETWKRQLNYAFVVSPFGGGPDCHRTWEALLLGCIVIIKSSPLDDLFEELPVWCVQRWSDLTQDALESTIETFKPRKFNFEKLKLKYWVSRF